MKKKLENNCIKVLNKEHGKKVIDYYNSLGVDTQDLEGCSVGDYYGLFNGKFDSYSNPRGSTIITLPKVLTYPRVMMVSENGLDWAKRVVFLEKKNVFMTWTSATTLEDAENTLSTSYWQYAKEVEEDKIEEKISKESLLQKVKELEEQINRLI